MSLGGVLLACFGIIIIVLVANGRWPNVWNAALGGSTTPVNNAGTSTTNETPVVTPIPVSGLQTVGGF